MRKPTFCICENKDADQLQGAREADQRLCFRYIDSTIPLLPRYEISSLLPSCVVVETGLCGTWSESRRPVFSQRGSYVVADLVGGQLFSILASYFNHQPIKCIGRQYLFTIRRIKHAFD